MTLMVGPSVLLATHVVDDSSQRLIQTDRRSEASRTAQLRDVGHPSLHVFEASAVGLIVRHVDDLRGAASQLAHELGQRVDTHLAPLADVEYLANRPRVID